jgi:hypothetical protein
MTYPVVPDVPAASVAPYPAGATPLVASSGNQAAATAAATLAAASGKYTYITGFEIVGTGATAASVVNATVSDGTWTETFPVGVVAGVNAQNSPLVVEFNPPLRSSAVNTAITVTCPSLGSGNTNNCVNAHGYQL